MAFDQYLINQLLDYVLAANSQPRWAQALRAEPRVFLRWHLGDDGCPQFCWVRG